MKRKPTTWEQQRLRLENRTRLIRAYLSGGEPSGATPTAAYIETTSRCNLDCPMCARQLAGPEWLNVDMSSEDFETALAALAPTCELVLPFAGGEPLLHRDLPHFIAAIKASGRRVELATNATLLNRKIARDLFLARVDTLVISLDAASPESYAAIRRGGDFERTRAGIMTLLRTKRQMHASTWVIVQMVSLPENRHETSLFRKQWQHVDGVDVVRIKADEVNVERVRSGRFGQQSSPRPCHFPWLGPLMIRYDGNIYPCCHSWRGDPVGHIAQSSTAEIWNGDEMRALRRAHLEGRAAEEYPACRECQAVTPHESLVIGSLLVPSHVSRRAIPYVEGLNRALGRLLIKSS